MHNLGSHRFNWKILMTLILVGVPASLRSGEAQKSKQRASGPDRNVEAIVERAARAAQSVTPEGISLTTGNPLVSNRDLSEIRRLADSAVPRLSEYLHEKSSLKQQIALRLLGTLSSDKALDALDEFAINSGSSFVRSTALDWISSARHREKDVKTLETSAQNDPDKRVRKHAVECLSRVAPLMK